MARDDLKAKVVLDADTKGAEKGIKRVEGSFRKFGSWLSTRFVFTLGDVSRAFSALTTSITDSAALESQTRALELNLAAQGVALEGFIKNLDQAAQGQISQADLIKQSANALLLGIPADKIAGLLEVAGVSAIAFGRTFTQAFEDIVVGIGRNSPMILDNIGLVGLKSTKAYSDYAASIGKSVDAMDAEESKLALINAALAEGKIRVDNMAGAQSKLSLMTNQGAAAWADFTVKLAQWGSVVVTTVAAGMVTLIRDLTKLPRAIGGVTEKLANMGSHLPVVGGAFGLLKESISGVNETIDNIAGPGSGLDNMAEGLDAAAKAAWFSALNVDIFNVGLEEEKVKLNESADAAKRNAQATNEAADATEKLKEATSDETTALDEGTTALDAYYESLQKRNREEERGIKILERKIVVEKQASSLEGNRGGMNLFPGLSGSRFSFTTFTPWDEMTSAQRQRYLALGGKPPEASRGWIESP